MLTRTACCCFNVGSAKALPCFASPLVVVRQRRLSATTGFLHVKFYSHQSPRKATLRLSHVRVCNTFLLRFLREKHKAQYQTYSVAAVSRFPAFENAGVDVAAEFLQGDEVVDDIKWTRTQKMDSLAQELVELYEELQEALTADSVPNAPQEEGRRVQNLGYGVCVQHNILSFDPDGNENSPATILREESRSVVHHALDAMQGTRAIAVTGQPGIGKTRGSMMYAIQMLLHRKAAVLYVGCKWGRMLLFLPRENGLYRVWTASSDVYVRTKLIRDERVVAVIDPPEDIPYSSSGCCRILKFVSNNAEKHFRNWEKDGTLLVTSMPCATEVVAMTQILWDEKKTPHRWQHGEEFNTLQGRMQEIEKRIDLVGPIPRLVFSSRLFRNAIKNCRLGATAAAADLSDSDLYMALRASYPHCLTSIPLLHREESFS